MFIDCHIHVLEVPSCPHPATGKQGLDIPENQIELFDRYDIEKAVILPIATSDSTWFVQSNEEVLRIAEKFPGRYIPFCNIDPRAMMNDPEAPLAGVLSFYRKRGCKGIGEVTANLELDDPRVENLFSAAQEAELPLTFHLATHCGKTYGLIDAPGLPKLEKALQKFSKLKFFGHSQAFWSEISAGATNEDKNGYPPGRVIPEGAVVRLMRQYPNLYGDLSAHSGYNALARDEDHAVKFLNEFQDRLFFGTDYCTPGATSRFYKLSNLLSKLLDEGRISETVFRKIARENIIRVLEL